MCAYRKTWEVGVTRFIILNRVMIVFTKEDYSDSLHKTAFKIWISVGVLLRYIAFCRIT